MDASTGPAVTRCVVCSTPCVCDGNAPVCGMDCAVTMVFRASVRASRELERTASVLAREPDSGTLQDPCMVIVDAWANVLVVDTTDSSVLAEGVVGLVSRRKRWHVAEPPVVLPVLQNGAPGFIVIPDQKGHELARLPYEPNRKRRVGVSQGESLRLQHFSFEALQ